jgi:hypothetical protein
MADDERLEDIRAYRGSFVGMILLACTTFLIFGTWRLYGATGALPQAGAWIVLFALACRWFVPHPRRVLLLGLLSMLIWVGVVLIYH